MIDRIAGQSGVSKRKVMKLAGFPGSSYYYRAKQTKGGIPPSATTLHQQQGEISNESVVEVIKAMLGEEFKDYWGYHNVAKELRQRGYKINDKKVYRLMKAHKLLRGDLRLKPNRSGRKFVKYRKVKTEKPLDCVEMDIKFVWIPQKGKNAYLLSLIDVHTRKILGYLFAWNVKAENVLQTCAELIDAGVMDKGVVIRSDNGSQFIARQVRDYLAEAGITQEFTHVATPEENGHVEAYHGILKKELFDRYEYHTFEEFDTLIARYVDYYNNKRRHGGLKRRIPQEVWDSYQQQKAA